MKLSRPILLLFPLFLASALLPLSGYGQTEGIDPKALIERILVVESRQRDQIHDLVLDGEYVESEETDGESAEKIRLVKKIYIKYLADTAWYHEDYIEYYKDGKLQPESSLRAEEADRKEKKKKRGSRYISYPMLEPFHPEKADEYEITYAGITANAIDGYVCHQFQVDSKVEDDQHINGDYYFDADSFQLVRVDFSPARLVKKLMFKLSELAMSISYAPAADGYWFPSQFDIRGKGRAAFFFGVDFAGTEYYRNPQVNTGLNDSIFEDDHD